MILSTLLLLTPFAALPQERKARQLDRRPTQGQQAECENCRAKAKQGSQKGRKKAVKSAKSKNRGQDIRKKLGAAVRSGKITREEAGEKMRAFKLEQGGEGQPSAGARVPEDMMGFRRRLGAAVQSGKITREEAGEKMRAFTEKRGQSREGEQGQRGLKGQAQKDRFQKGPRAKSLKRAWQNHQKEAAVGKAAAGNKNRASKREALAGFRQRLGAAIKSGKITRKEAGQKMAAMRKKVAAKKDSRPRPQD